MSYSSSGDVNITFNGIDRLSAVMSSVSQNAQSLLMSFNGVAQSVVSLYTGMTRLLDSSVYVDRANLMVAKSARTLAAAQEALNVAVRKYGPDSDQATKAANDLAIAQDGLEVSQERAKLAADNQRATILQFAVGVIPTAISAVANLTTAMEAMGIASTACLGPIGLIVAGITALTTAVAYMASHWTPTFHDMAAAVELLRLETDRMIASGSQTIEQFNEQFTAIGKLKAAYLEWYNLVKQTSEEFTSTLSTITEEYNIVQAQGSDAFKNIAQDYQKAFASGNLQLAAGFLMSIHTRFKVTLADAKHLVDEFLASLSTGIEIPAITIPGITSLDLFDQLNNAMNLDKATELAKKYVDRFRTAWGEGATILVMMLAGQLANEAKISVDDAVKLLERLKDAAQTSADAVGTAIDPLSALFDKLQSHWALDNAEKAGEAFVGQYMKAWKADLIVSAMQTALVFSKQAGISLEDAVRILDELMNKIEAATKEINGEMKAEPGFGSLEGTLPPVSGGPWYFWGTHPDDRLKRLLGLAEGGIVTRPTLAMVGEAGPEAIIPLNQGEVGTTLQINSPLLVVEGSVDKRTADYLVSRLENILSNVVIEPSSSSGSSTHKRIRLRG
jgi:hypothetical protein